MYTRTLTEKENVLRAILRTGEPEWVPILADAVDVVIPSPMLEYAPFGQSGTDWFGCYWQWDDASFSHGPDARQPVPIADITQWRDKLQLPDLDAIDWKEAAIKDTAHCDRENKLMRVFCVIGPFERMSFLLGMENAFVSMYEEPEEYKAMIECLADFKIRLFEKIINAYHPDEIFFHDDLGSANGPMISPEIYRELIKPCHKKIADAVKSHGVIFTYHSCGHMEAFIDDLIDIGADMINPLQPMNNWKEIAEKYAGKVSFDVGAESRANYIETTREELIEDCHKVIDIFAPTKSFMIECYISNMACRDKGDIINQEARDYGGQFYKQ